MNKETQHAKVFSRRSFIVGALQASVLMVLGGRLAWLQIAQASRYKMLSDKNRINIKMIAPSRGRIVDRLGKVLATNNQNFRVLIIPEQTDDIEGSLRALKQHVDIDEKKIEDVLKKSKKVARFVPIEIKDELSWEEVSKIEVNLPDLPGLSIDVGEVRSYPVGEATAHIVGYVGLPNEADLNGDPLLTLPGFRMGKTGIEKSFDQNMRGSAGKAEVEVNVVGREVRELNVDPGRQGSDIVLSIDSELQLLTQQTLAKEKSASAVIMDVHTGAIYAMASHPSFDPNLFTHGMSAAQWEALLANPAHPLTNKAIAGQYPPASTFKMITALAGLKDGKITQERTVYCPGFYEFGGDRFHCWKHAGHGNVNLEDALAESCDTYFYHLATEIGIENIASAARELGLGHKLGLGLSEEHPGLVPDKAWKMGYHGDVWRPGETIVASIGQGYLQATPLQLAVMTSRFVNGGYAVKPWIAGYVGQKQRVHKKWPKMALNDWHLQLIRQGMERTVNHEKGTAYGSRIEQEGFEMAGKTGTAQVARISMAQRQAGVKNEDLPWKQRHHGLFVGYAPYKNPRYACAVVVEHGIGGSASAAPMGKDLLIKAQQRNPAVRDIKPVSAENMADGLKPKPASERPI